MSIEGRTQWLAEQHGDFERVAIVGMACSEFKKEHGSTLEELVFGVAEAAMRQAGIRKADLDLAVVATLDLYDGRTISYGMTLPATGGYMLDEYRLENDSAAALISAASAIRAGQVDLAIVTAYHNPEVSAQHGQDVSAFYDQSSNYAFDGQFTRPVGLTGTSALAMHALRACHQTGTSRAALAEVAADQISRGAAGARGYRAPSTSEDVLNSPLVAWPLTELMLPATSTGAVSFVLASAPRSKRCRRTLGWISGMGISSSPYVWNEEWLADPGAATSRAAHTALSQAGIDNPIDQIDVVELTAFSPALMEPVLAALGMSAMPTDRVNPSGGVLSNFPGLANGALRVYEAITWLAARNDGSSRGLVHSLDHVTGTVSSSAAVLVLEAS